MNRVGAVLPPFAPSRAPWLRHCGFGLVFRVRVRVKVKVSSQFTASKTLAARGIADLSLSYCIFELFLRHSVMRR